MRLGHVLKVYSTAPVQEECHQLVSSSDRGHLAISHAVMPISDQESTARNITRLVVRPLIAELLA